MEAHSGFPPFGTNVVLPELAAPVKLMSTDILGLAAAVKAPLPLHPYVI